jgi:hypothetical protein
LFRRFTRCAQVIKETLRLHATVPFISRQVLRDDETTLQGRRLKKGKPACSLCDRFLLRSASFRRGSVASRFVSPPPCFTLSRCGMAAW